MASSNGWKWTGLFVLIVSVSACSKTPKQQMLAGFSNSCYAGQAEQVKAYCDCMVKSLNDTVPASVVNDPNIEPEQATAFFGAMAMKAAPICKAALN